MGVGVYMVTVKFTDTVKFTVKFVVSTYMGGDDADTFTWV